ncbi:MAG: LPXTG cell wall anchor domain-containing protein [Humibacillus sp.]|nr:LPXTG cell wall anchor domain-containing protein [Humibacillus sp.]MDN5777271.1 LPXTG cell wall anchor domain-containing protein [Humibacillus sp.]
MRTIIRTAGATIAAAVTLGLFAGPASAAPGDSVTDPILVTDLRDPALDGAIQDPISTWTTPDLPCDDSRSFTKTSEGTPAVDEVSHQEWTVQERTRDVKPGTPGQDAVTHSESQYAQVIEHPAVAQETAKLQQWSRRVIDTEAKPSVPGTGSHFEKESIWRAEGDVPEGEGWSICLQRYKEGSTTFEKEYQWQQLIPGTPFQPAVPATFHSEYTEFLAEGVVPSDDLPVKSGLYAAWSWRKGSTKVIITVPAKKAWTETVYYTGKPGGSTNKGDAVWVSYAPKGYPVVVDTKTVTDEDAVPATEDVYGEWSDWTVKSEGRLEDPTPTLKTNTTTHEYRAGEPTTVIDVTGSPAVEGTVTYYAYSDGKLCSVTPPVTTPVTTPPAGPAGPARPAGAVSPAGTVIPTENKTAFPVLAAAPATVAAQAPAKTVMLSNGAPHTGGAGYDRLPTTGDNTTVIAMMALALLFAGGAIRFGARRRTNQA